MNRKILLVPLKLPTAGIDGFYINRFERYNIVHNPAGSGAVPCIPHCHSHFEVFWINSGAGLVVTDFESIPVGPNTLLLLSPGSVHAWVKSQNMAGTLLGFTRSFNPAFDALLMAGSRRVIQIDAEQAPTIERLMKDIFDESRWSNPKRGEVVKSLLNILSHKILWLCPPAADAASERALTRRFRVAVETECPRLTTVKQLADHLRVSRSLLHRRVRADSGRSPSEWIHERLILAAQRQLRYSDAAVKEIARDLGFADAAYFGRFFRRHCQMTPGDFRLSASPLLAELTPLPLSPHRD
jgi:AraC-like DNA-binding protein/mannose-6-phosphate isomerase-like protein (cupin superfamily)